MLIFALVCGTILLALFLIWIHVLQKALKREHSLWQLCNIENDIEKASEDVDAEKSNSKDVMEKLEKFEHEARDS